MIFLSAYDAAWTVPPFAAGAFVVLTFNARSHHRETIRLHAAAHALALDRHRDTEELIGLREAVVDRDRRVRELEAALSRAAAERDDLRVDVDRVLHDREHYAALWADVRDELIALQARWNRAFKRPRDAQGRMVAQTGSETGVEGSQAAETVFPVVGSTLTFAGCPDASVEVLAVSGEATDAAGQPVDAPTIPEWTGFGTGRYLGLTREDDAGQAVRQSAEEG